MHLLLRVTTQKRWTETQFDWLPEGDVPADPVCDFRTDKNKASVWKIEKVQKDERLLLERRIAIALAARRDKVDKLDYMLLDGAAVGAAGIEVCKDEGKSADPQLNASLHCNLEKISAGRLVELVKTILSSKDPPQLERLNAKVVAIAIWEGLCEKHLDGNLVKSDLLTDAAVHILKSLAQKKLSHATIDRKVIVAVANHYLHEHAKNQLAREYVKDEYIQEAQHWVNHFLQSGS